MSNKYFITGATGLLGHALIESLASDGNQITAFVRNEEKAKKMLPQSPYVSIVNGTLEVDMQYNGEIDYIIHAAAPTDSSFFTEHPAETIDSIVLGTRNVLDLARRKKVKSMVNLSSMEVYGITSTGEPLTEDKQFYLDPLNPRSSYPMAKRLGETMCVACSKEYNVPVKTVRLAQVLGKTMIPGDNRVINQFIRAANKGHDIELATAGDTKQTYIGLDDAVSGILTVLHKGEDGSSYNLANDDTYCSIKEVADIVAGKIANGSIKVTTNTDPNSNKYPPSRTLRIVSDKLRSLGWEPSIGLEEALRTLANKP